MSSSASPTEIPESDLPKNVLSQAENAIQLSLVEVTVPINQARSRPEVLFPTLERRRKTPRVGRRCTLVRDRQSRRERGRTSRGSWPRAKSSLSSISRPPLRSRYRQIQPSSAFVSFDLPPFHVLPPLPLPRPPRLPAGLRRDWRRSRDGVGRPRAILQSVGREAT